MALPNVRDVLASFSPALDFCAITAGDGRVKIWDTLKGQVQTEFADLILRDESDIYTSARNGHLSLDYTCMKWMPLIPKKTKKSGTLLLVLGTGSGDLLALDVSAGQLKWRISDCHPGGVNAISFSRHNLCMYTAGSDGMVCQIDGFTGNLLSKFKASTKAISTMSVSPDGRTLATAAAQLKIFSCLEYKKIQKFSGHPVSVRCMIFTDDGNYLFSCATGERYIAIWKLDGSQKRHSSCVLSMDHPAVYIDTKGEESRNSEDVGLFVLAITELGICYVWHGRNIEELQQTRPTKISLLYEGLDSKSRKASLPSIFAARMHSIVRNSSGVISVAYGSIVKPTFERLQVQHGTDVSLSFSEDGVLLPKRPHLGIQKGHVLHAEVTAIGRENAEDAMLPVPKIYDLHGRKRKHNMQQSTDDVDETMVDVEGHGKDAARREDSEEDIRTVRMEDRLRSLGILANEGNLEVPITSALDSTSFSDAQSLIEANLPQKKIKAAVLSMSDKEACKFLAVLIARWKLRSGSGKDVLPWVSAILIYHGPYVQSLESSSHFLDTLYQMTSSKCAAIQPLLQLSGRLQLIAAQIGKGGQTVAEVLSKNSQVDESGDEDEVDEYVYGEEIDDSLSGSDDE